MMSEFTKKLSLVILLLLSSVFYCYAQEASLEQPAITDLNTLDLWNKIELNLSSLEQDQNNMKLFIDQQETQIESLENAYLDQQQISMNLECSLAKSENAMKRWKTFSIALGSVTIALGITTVVEFLILLNK